MADVEEARKREDETRRRDLEFAREVWRALWIMLDALAKRWGFGFEGPLEKRVK